MPTPAIPAALGRVLSVVRRLIDIGRQLAGTVRQRAAAPGFASFARPFGTLDLAVILARITGGLRRATALEAKLCQRAERGRELTPSPFRMPAVHQPRPARHAQPGADPANAGQDPRLDNLPTEAEIATELRRRPIGAVIVDICHGLGIMPGDLDRPFWDELCHAIIAYGGSLAGFLGKLAKRTYAFGFGYLADLPDPPWPAAPPGPPALSTHPP